MKVISYLATLPNKLLSSERANEPKIHTLHRFVQGVCEAGDIGVVSSDMTYQDCDVAVMLGFLSIYSS